MSQRLHWCYNDYMSMPISQLIYWISKDADNQEEIERFRKEQKRKMDAQARRVNAKR